MLLPLLLTACGVSLPDTIHIDAREPSHHSHRPERDAEGLIRTAQGECLDIHGDDHRSLIRYRCHGQANQLFRWDGRSGTIRQNARCLDVAGGETRDGSRVILFACNGRTTSVGMPMAAASAAWLRANVLMRRRAIWQFARAMAAARSSLIGTGDRGKGTACQQAVGARGWFQAA